jgi:predicted fused transcriptional regulator/phosphomethylpyrimidine kinase
MRDEEKQNATDRLSLAMEKIVGLVPPWFIPEVGMNVAYALPDARVTGDVAAVEGRIVRLGNKVHPVGDIKFGASSHVARIVLTAMKFDSDIRSAVNIRFSEEIIKKAEDLLLEVRSFDREKEPSGVSTMDWGVAFCCSEGDVPDVIYDRGGVGKEPMIRFLGEDPLTVVNNIIMIAERINNKNKN